MVELDKFRLIELIGDGSMGEVYKAHQVSMDRTVAVKVLSAGLARDEVFKKRFMHEARAIGKLNHANIVQGIDFGQSGEHLYFVMEYVDGQTLYDILRQSLLDEDEVLEIGLQVARALEHGHGQGIVHRDIKPGNIMITSEGTVKVTDYGLAKRTGGAAAELHSAGEVVGTPYYISPEQARGEGDIDIRSDIYSLGATLYHAATGRPPFPGKGAQEIIGKAIKEPFPDPRKERPQLSSAFAKLVMRMTQKEKRKRPASPSELVGEIERVRRASADERHLKTIGANLRRTFRRVVEGQSAVSPKVKFVIGGVVAAAAIAVVLAVLFFGAQELGPAPASDAPLAAKSEPPVEKPIEKPAQVEKPEAPPASESRVEENASKAQKQLDAQARDAYLAAEKFAKTAKDLEQVIKRFDVVAAAYDSPFGEKAKKLARELRGRWEKEGEEELKRRRASAEQALASDNFGAAVTAYKEFPAHLVRTPAGAEAGKLTRQMLEHAMARCQHHCDEAEKLAAAGKYDKAIGEYGKVLGFGIEKIASEVKARIAVVKEKKAKVLARAKKEEARRVRQLLYSFYSQYAALVERKDFAGALGFCEGVLADGSKEPIHERVRLEKADAGMVLSVEDAARVGARRLKLQEYEFELEGGSRVKGLVRDVSGETIEVQLASMRRAVRGIKISRLAPQAFVKLALFALGKKPESHLACAVYLLLVRNDAAGAQKQLELAKAPGLDVSRHLAMAATLKKQQKEEDAKTLLAQFRDLLKSKKWEEAAEAAGRLTGEYEETQAVKSSRREIEKAHTDAILQIAAREQARAREVRPVRDKGKKKRLAGLVGTYFNGRNFNKQRARRIDAKVDFDWKDKKPHPDVNKDNFSVRWEGIIAIPRSGRYTFIVNSDDGCRMWLGGQELINDWRNKVAEDSSKELTLKKGHYSIKIEYFDAGGAASVKFLWSVGGRRQVIPAKYLYHSSRQGKR